MGIFYLIVMGFLVIVSSGYAATATTIFEPTCPPLFGQGIRCSNREVESFDCSTGMVEVGTVAHCRPYYHAWNTTSMCGPEGWTDKEFSCKIVCGKSKMSNGNDRPFRASIYQKVKRDLDLKICSGTLIGDGQVVTLGYCLIDHLDNQLEKDVILVGLGPESNETLYPVKAVQFSPGKNDTDIKADDLVILTLDQFTLSEDILPACLPTCPEMEEVALRDGAIGELSARGHTPQKLKIVLTGNRSDYNFCAGNPDGQDVKGTDIGLGLTMSLGEHAHFVFGILSPANPACRELKTLKRLLPSFNSIVLKMNVPVSRTTRTVLDAPPEQDSYITILYQEESTENSQPIYTNVEPTVEPTTPLSSIDISFVTSEIIHDVVSYTATSTTISNPNYETFIEISKDLQMTLTNLTITNKFIKTETLLNSIKFAKNLTQIEVSASKFTTGFKAVEELPRIRSYVLQSVEYEIRPTTFGEYFLFYIKRSWDTAEMVSSFDELTIDDDHRRFHMKPSSGNLVVADFPDLRVDRFLSALPLDLQAQNSWRRVSLHNTQVTIALIPPTLVHLTLSNIEISSDELQNLLTHQVPELESLRLNDLPGVELTLESIPKTLQILRLDRVNFTVAPETKVMTYLNLTEFYWGVGVEMDDFIITNFMDIFPKLETFTIFWEENNITFVKRVLDLDNLKIFKIRVHHAQIAEGQEILKLLNFDRTTLPKASANITAVDLILVRKKDSTFLTKYIDPTTLIDEVTKVGDEFDLHTLQDD